MGKGTLWEANRQTNHYFASFKRICQSFELCRFPFIYPQNRPFESWAMDYGRLMTDLNLHFILRRIVEWVKMVKDFDKIHSFNNHLVICWISMVYKSTLVWPQISGRKMAVWEERFGKSLPAICGQTFWSNPKTMKNLDKTMNFWGFIISVSPKYYGLPEL